mgnify:CR=1 FL=1
MEVTKRNKVEWCLFLFFTYLIFSSSLFAQGDCPKSENKKAIKNYQQAADLVKARKDYDKARALVEDAIDEDPDFADAYLLQGRLAQKKHDDKTMEQSYQIGRAHV